MTGRGDGRCECGETRDMAHECFPGFVAPSHVPPSQKALDLLLQAIAVEWADGVRPGVHLSRLKDETYYAAIHRYPSSAHDRKVIFAHTAPSLDEAIKGVASQYLGAIAVRVELAKAIGGEDVPVTAHKASGKRRNRK